jgi:hypothetical protein
MAPQSPLDSPTLVGSDSTAQDGELVARAPVLTIRWHPDLKRVGHSALLSRGRIEVSRLQPFFGAQGSSDDVNVLTELEPEVPDDLNISFRPWPRAGLPRSRRPPNRLYAEISGGEILAYGDYMTQAAGLARWWMTGIVLTLGGLVGCGGDNAVSQGLGRWSQAKLACGSYHYAVVDSSFTGWRMTTTVQIAADVPAERRIEISEVLGTPLAFTMTNAWDETGSDIGTNVRGRPAKTMEQLYSDCEHDVLSQDPGKNDISFAADDRGVLQHCWYVPHGCQDDCTVGVSLSDFACGAVDPLPPAGSPVCQGATDHTQAAAIQVATSPSRSPVIDIAVYCDGSAVRVIDDPYLTNGDVMPKTYDPGSPQIMAFLADLDAVGDTSTLATAAACSKPASLGTVTTVSARGRSTGDLQCLDNPTPAATALANDCLLLSSEN